jgi:hypothetical protein
VALVLEASARVKAAKTSSQMLALHRIGGYLFHRPVLRNGVFSWLTAFATGAPIRRQQSPSISLLAMILSPLLFIT